MHYFPFALPCEVLLQPGSVWTLCRPVCGPVTLRSSLYYYSCKCASRGEICLQFTWIRSAHPALPLVWPNGLFTFEVLLLANHSLSVICLLSHWEASKRACGEEVASIWLWKVPPLHSLPKLAGLCAGDASIWVPACCALCLTNSGLLFICLQDIQQRQTLNKCHSYSKWKIENTWLKIVFDYKEFLSTHADCSTLCFSSTTHSVIIEADSANPPQ